MKLNASLDSELIVSVTFRTPHSGRKLIPYKDPLSDLSFQLYPQLYLEQVCSNPISYRNFLVEY